MAKVSCILRHWGAQLIQAYSWERPAILVAGMGRCVGGWGVGEGGKGVEGVYFYFFYFFTFIPVPLSSLFLSFISFLPYSGR